MAADFEGTEDPDNEYGDYTNMYGLGGIDSLGSGAPFARIYGGADGDTLYYSGSGTSELRGEAGNDNLYGGNFNDKLYGGPGDDWMFAGSGKNVFEGGGGRDHFGFDTLPDGSLDKIKDFNPKKDYLNFVPTVYTVGIGGETLAKSQFRKGAKAKDADDNFGYDKNSGLVWFDIDGKGGESQVSVVKLDKDLGLTYANFQF